MGGIVGDVGYGVAGSLGRTGLGYARVQQQMATQHAALAAGAMNLGMSGALTPDYATLIQKLHSKRRSYQFPKKRKHLLVTLQAFFSHGL